VFRRRPADLAEVRRLEFLAGARGIGGPGISRPGGALALSCCCRFPR
jgi:hypothetical protein